jgi:hypothetical protein
MRRCYQISLENIPQSEWDLYDYLDIVRMWNLSQGNPYDPTLDHDEKGLYVKCRRDGTLILGLTHDLLPFQVYGKGLDDLILVDHGAAIRWQERLEPFTSAASLASEVIRKEILAEMERHLLAPKLNLDLMKTRPGTQSCLTHFTWEERLPGSECWWCPLCGSNVSQGRRL